MQMIDNDLPVHARKTHGDEFEIHARDVVSVSSRQFRTSPLGIAGPGSIHVTTSYLLLVLFVQLLVCIIKPLKRMIETKVLGLV